MYSYLFQCPVYTEVNVSPSRETKEEIDLYLSQYYIGNTKDIPVYFL